VRLWNLGALADYLLYQTKGRSAATCWNKRQRENQDEPPRPNTRSRLNPPQNSQAPQLSSSSGPISRGQSPTSQPSAASQAASTPLRSQQGPRTTSRRSVVQIASRATTPTNPQAIPNDKVTPTTTVTKLISVTTVNPVALIDSIDSVIAATPPVTVNPVVPINTNDVSTQTSPINIVTSINSDSPDTPDNPIPIRQPRINRSI